MGAKAPARKSAPPPNRVSQELTTSAGWKWPISAPGVCAPCSKKTPPIQAKAMASSRWRGRAVSPAEINTNSDTTVAAKVVKVTI